MFVFLPYNTNIVLEARTVPPANPLLHRMVSPNDENCPFTMPVHMGCEASSPQH